MKKTIYFKAGTENKPIAFNSLDLYMSERGLFDPFHFREYMDKYEGAESVNFFVANGEKSNVRIYHIEPQGVTVKYAYSKEGPVAVDLFGSEAIGEVEKIILNAAKRFEKLSAKVPA